MPSPGTNSAQQPVQFDFSEVPGKKNRKKLTDYRKNARQT
jgi:hypothetical protein